MYTWMSTTIILKARLHAAETAPTTTGVKFRNDLVTLVTYHVIGSEPSVSASNRSLSVVQKNQLFLTLMLLLLLFNCPRRQESIITAAEPDFTLFGPQVTTSTTWWRYSRALSKNERERGEASMTWSKRNQHGARLDSSHVLSRMQNSHIKWPLTNWLLLSPTLVLLCCVIKA